MFHWKPFQFFNVELVKEPGTTEPNQEIKVRRAPTRGVESAGENKFSYALFFPCVENRSELCHERTRSHCYWWCVDDRSPKTVVVELTREHGVGGI
jgi:hypothetical protein